MKVFLDMDGIIVNFQLGVCENFDLPYPPQVYNFFDPIRPQVNDACTIDFWCHLEWMHDGARILDAVLHKFRIEDVYLLTTPMPNPESWTGKAHWINDHIPAFNKRFIITQVPKSLFANPDTLLIDDKDENIEEFVAAGGHGILVPRPWNKLYEQTNESLQIVKNKLETL